MAKGAAGVATITSVVLPAVLLLITMWPLHVAVVGAESTDHRCFKCGGYQADCPDCDAGRCCSPNHYCGTGLRYCTVCYCGSSPRVLCDFCYCEKNCRYADGSQQYSYTNATYSSAPEHDDDGDNNVLIVATYSSSSSGSTSSWSRDGYGSAAICGPSSSSSNTTHVSTNSVIIPGQCLQVRNHENGRRATVKIRDRQDCGNISTTSLALGYDVFHHLDTSGGKRDVRGYLTIAYKHVRCMHS